jgi:uncharacterized membrane protein (UPF0136 family)
MKKGSLPSVIAGSAFGLLFFQSARMIGMADPVLGLQMATGKTIYCVFIQSSRWH